MGSCGGERAGSGVGSSAGIRRCVRMRPMTSACWISAISRSRPPQRSHASTSNPPPVALRAKAGPPEPRRRRKTAAHQVRPLAPRCGRRLRRRFRRRDRRPAGRAWHDRSTPRRPRAHHAMIEEQVHPWPRHQHGQPSQEVAPIEPHMRRAVLPQARQPPAHVPVFTPMQALAYHGRTQHGPAQPLEEGGPCRSDAGAAGVRRGNAMDQPDPRAEGHAATDTSPTG